MIQTTIKDLKKGDFFTMREHEYPNDSQVWVRDEYDRSTKKYCCYKWDDVNHVSLKKGTMKVYADFIF